MIKKDGRAKPRGKRKKTTVYVFQMRAFANALRKLADSVDAAADATTQAGAECLDVGNMPTADRGARDISAFAAAIFRAVTQYCLERSLGRVAEPLPKPVKSGTDPTDLGQVD